MSTNLLDKRAVLRGPGHSRIRVVVAVWTDGSTCWLLLLDPSGGELREVKATDCRILADEDVIKHIARHADDHEKAKHYRGRSPLAICKGCGEVLTQADRIVGTCSCGRRVAANKRLPPPMGG